ncbi:hypothetical protein E4U16_007647, partial [Claviceps sp. LM84 group G4]
MSIIILKELERDRAIFKIGILSVHICLVEQSHVLAASPKGYWVKLQNRPRSLVALNQLLDPLESVDIDRFLAQETEDWCNARLEEMGGFEAPHRDGDEPYKDFYLGLQLQIQAHQDSGAQPILQLNPIPLGGSSEYMRLFDQTNMHREDSNLEDSSIPL